MDDNLSVIIGIPAVILAFGLVIAGSIWVASEARQCGNMCGDRGVAEFIESTHNNDPMICRCGVGK